MHINCNPHGEPIHKRYTIGKLCLGRWGGGSTREILTVNTGFNKFAQSLIVWSCHARCTLPFCRAEGEYIREMPSVTKRAQGKRSPLSLSPRLTGIKRNLPNNVEYTVPKHCLGARKRAQATY